MPLLAPVIRAARAKRSEFQAAFGAGRLAAWRSRLAPYWHPLPALPAAPSENGSPHRAGRRLHVAIDGTSHAVQLSTGAHLILAAAAACGPPPVGQRDTADVQVMRGRHDFADAATARDLLMRSLEADAAFDAASVLVGAGLSHQSILWMDGSLYGELAHVAAPPERLYADADEPQPQPAEDRPQRWWSAVVSRANAVLHARANLMRLAEHAGLWVIGVSKTQRSGFLADALELSAMGGVRAVDPDDERPSDGELLSMAGAGWSHPVVLDAGRFLNRVSDTAFDALDGCPAIVSCYVRPHPADLPLRVDVPASAIGLDHRFLPDDVLDVPADMGARNGLVNRPPAWLPDLKAMRPVVEAVLVAYGGMNVYNGPLYAVDRLVRLSRRELETRYLPICAKVVGLPPSALSVDRGRRRFISD
jgi:hypothetical protein